MPRVPGALLVATLAVGLWAAAPVAGQTVSAPSVDSIAVRGLIQAQFNTTSAEGDPEEGGEPDSEWEIRRARIGLRAYVADWIQGYVEGDFGRRGVRLTDGYLDLKFDRRFVLRAGQFKVPFDALELVSSRELPVIERDGLPRGASGLTPNGLLDDLGYNARDIGAQWSGDWDAWGAAAGVFNGSGDNEEDIDDGKQLVARLTAKLPAGWRLAGAWTGLRVSEPPAADEATWYHATELAVTAGTYGEPGWRVIGMAFFGDDYDPEFFGDDDATFVALHGIVSYHFPLHETPYLIGWEPIVRAGWTRIDDGASETVDETEFDTTLATAGVNLYWQERVVTQAQVDWVEAEPGESDVAVRLQAGFAF